MIYFIENDSSTDLVTIRNWRDDGNNMFLSNGMTLRNGRLVVPYKGVYQVYSFIDMQLSKHENRNPKENYQIQQSIFKSNIQNVGTKDEEIELMRSFRPYEVTDTVVQDIYDTYLSADVELNAGDEVYVKVWHKNFLRYPETNCFGIRLL